MMSLLTSPMPQTPTESITDGGVDRLVRFPDGLLGFPECRSFRLTATARPGFFWLRSTEHAALVFLLIDPFVYFEGYVVDLGDADVRVLAAQQPGDVAILAMVTLPRGAGEPPTANLQGPVALNLDRGVARQVILPDSPFGLRCPFDIAPADAA